MMLAAALIFDLLVCLGFVLLLGPANKRVGGEQ